MILENKFSSSGIRAITIGIYRRFSFTAVLIILILPTTFGCQHTGQKEALPPNQAITLKKYFSETYTGAKPKQQEMKSRMTLFVEKCSACHDPNRALTVIKDPDIWAQTIKRMQYYSKGAISKQEVEELIDFHVTEQQREISTFEETCTKCHDDERINSRSMSEEQWLSTIKRMQQKAPELISDEKVNLLAAYFHRRELALARIFYGKCRFCHLDSSNPVSSVTLNGLVVLANEEFGRSMQIRNARNLISSHVERQKRDMEIYENKCTTCHLNGLTVNNKPGNNKESQEERTRAEWVSFIAELQGVELNKEIQNAINSQIDFHVSKY